MAGEFIPSSDNGTLIKAYATWNLDEASVLILNEHSREGARFTLKLKDAAPVQSNPVVLKAVLLGRCKAFQPPLPGRGRQVRLRG